MNKKKILLAMIPILAVVLVLAQQIDTKFTSQNNTDFAKTLTDKKVQLIDVRTAAEYDAGHIPGAINIDVRSETFNDDASKLNKSKPVALYCRTGGRSKAAAKKLTEKGFKVYELDKGISNWNGKTEK